MVQGAWARAHGGEGAGCQGRDRAPACQSCPLGPPTEGWAGEALSRLTLGRRRAGPEVRARAKALWLLRGVSVLVQCLSASPSEFRAAVFLYLLQC